jgi:hypothetical protein
VVADAGSAVRDARFVSVLLDRKSFVFALFPSSLTQLTFSRPPFSCSLPLRAFFGPHLSLPLPSLRSTLLSVPALSRNFLISPPGSPPVGWEQTLEEAPNPNPFPDTETEGSDGGWGDELARALRFLSVRSGGDEDDEDEQQAVAGRANDTADGRQQSSTTQLVVPTSSTLRPAITVSTPPTLALPPDGTATPPPGAAKITAVKATIESMLGRKRSFSDLGAHLGLAGVKSSITPTARPPTADERAYQE